MIFDNLINFFKIRTVGKYIFNQYFVNIGKDASQGTFWDVVVITTADYAQKHVFELQIESKRKRNELPLNFPIYVVADPPGPKIGTICITFLIEIKLL